MKKPLLILLLCLLWPGLALADTADFYSYLSAAQKGDYKSQHNLGLMYYQGVGTEQNYAEAFKWFSQAAEQGYGASQYYLGMLYEIGHGVGQDYVKAREWYYKAAKLKDQEAFKSLLRLQEQGLGVKQNPDPFALQRSSGTHGVLAFTPPPSLRTQFAKAKDYLYGEFVAQSNVQAMVHLHLARKHPEATKDFIRNEIAPLLKELAAQITREEWEEAREILAEKGIKVPRFSANK